MNIRTHFSGILAAVLAMAGVAQAAQAETLRISYFMWPGNGPFFVAQEKGFFAKEGVEVQLLNLEEHTAIFAAMDAGEIQAAQGGFPDAPVFSEPNDEPWVCVLALDDSRGGDGVLAAKDIRSIADLEGRSVAYLRGSMSQFYINVLLKEAGLSEADIELVDLSGEDSVQAFLLQEVDAVVTYEPWLSQGKSAEHGHLLTDTLDRPGLLGDCLMTKPGLLAERKKDFAAVARAWDAAVKYAEANPDEANDIIARSMGEDPAVVAEMLRFVPLYDEAMNRQYFGTPDQPGPIYQTMQSAIDVWSDLGLLKIFRRPPSSPRGFSTSSQAASGLWTGTWGQ